MNHLIIKIEPMPGSHFREAFEEAIEVAKRLRESFVLKFNDKRIKVSPDSSLEILCIEYVTTMNRR